MTTYTHPDVLGKGVTEGWADPITDPRQIDWTARQRAAVLPFSVLDGRPVNPCGPTGIRHGRNQLGHWGEQACADAVVTAEIGGGRWLVMVERADGYGWALPGGCIEPGEDCETAALRELGEETGLVIEHTRRVVLAPRYVPDPRASDEAWMVTVPTRVHLGTIGTLPALLGADDAKQAVWMPADTYAVLLTHVQTAYHGQIFPAHTAMLRELLI
ncbi:hypothetical protein GCM10009677_57480 [Sphaerisporangium rubeum]|uniref:ADP-ribose pyrophosphatase YjhB (NUDIX family) n=1 Tax=Sphaerisporangium rubeum TaxID=321317 RepID=A0A7X0M8W6_9ACTN|nr:NUDIX domain-containing protein [Sphaerisporangium rubeum]MBB6474336.1 ADP-ribose pyrophosphatase YjhB (NUDIX family) [Sphaerisporangium rubeum]